MEIVIIILSTIENLPDLMIVTRPSRNVDVVEGNTVTITCTVEGGTPATLDWYRNGMELTENGSIGIAHTSMRSVVLTLRNVTSLDNGDHTCVGTIAVGDVMRASVEVNVLSEFITIYIPMYMAFRIIAKYLLSLHTYPMAFYR